MGCFQWISPRALPAAYDLRARGWRLACESADSGQRECAGLIDGAGTGVAPEHFAPALRRRALAIEVGDSDSRARWLAAGFADALGSGARIDELDQRARRVLVARSGSATRLRQGRLELDLVARDALIDGSRLRLNPREFALLWRLAEARGEPVPRAVLLRDVWGLGFDPGTNSVAVHICRLRKKLALAGLASLLVTGPGDSGYRLFFANEEGPGPFVPRRIPLDEPPRLREHDRALVELAR